MRQFKFEINDEVKFDQSLTYDPNYSVSGEGKIIGRNGEYLSCLAYLISMADGTKLQVTEEQILGMA